MITSAEFREASSLGKEMLDGERALQDVAVAVSCASGVKSVAATAPTRCSAQEGRFRVDQPARHGRHFGRQCHRQGQVFLIFQRCQGARRLQVCNVQDLH